jgi:glycosyltransferase involved in cell wall biosynthesis
MTPSVSVLIRLYNGIEFLHESLASVCQQSYDDWDLLIGVNGHGPDGNDVHKKANEIVKQNKYRDQIRVINYPTVKGGAEVMNALVADAKAQWVAFLDVDDMWLETKLLKQIHIRDLYPHLDVIGTYCRYFGQMKGSPQIPVGEITLDDFKTCNPMINSSILMRKELTNFTDRFYLDDYDLWCRLALEGRRFYNLDDVLTLHRIHGASAYNASKKQDPEALRAHYFSNKN